VSTQDGQSSHVLIITFTSIVDVGCSSWKILDALYFIPDASCTSFSFHAVMIRNWGQRLKRPHHLPKMLSSWPLCKVISAHGNKTDLLLPILRWVVRCSFTHQYTGEMEMFLISQNGASPFVVTIILDWYYLYAHERWLCFADKEFSHQGKILWPDHPRIMCVTPQTNGWR